MSIKYIFRIDDICPDMNYVNFSRIRDLFFKYDIKPIIGVIPHNEDQKLVKQAGENGIEENKFWAEVKELQDVNGWAIALHGYNHVYTTEDSGMFKVNKRAEFAGIPLEEQNSKIEKGKAILLNHGLGIDAFMAPAHSMDWNTVKALKRNGIITVTDGNRHWPYFKRGVFFVPQVYSRTFFSNKGIHTICLHVNEWNEADFEDLRKKISSCGRNVTSFNEVAERKAEYKKAVYVLLGIISGILVGLDKKLRNVINHFPGIKLKLKSFLQRK